MSDFLEQLVLGLGRCRTVGRRLLVGVSGGADSVALLRGLAARHDGELVAAHLDHGLRPDSAADADWVRTLASDLGFPVVVRRLDVAAAVGQGGAGVEETARHIRYQFFQDAAREAGCEAVALAHTADDQAETILHHIVRGTGLAGLRGIPAVRPLADGIELVRPLLEIPRAEIEAYLVEIGQTYRTDPSNADPAHTRNRIRHQLLPLLEQNYNPQVRGALRRLARQAEEAETLLDGLARRLLAETLLSSAADACTLDATRLSRHPAHTVRGALVALWRQQEWPQQRMGFREWDALARLVTDGGALSLPGGLEGRVRRGVLTIARQAPGRTAQESPPAAT